MWLFKVGAGYVGGKPAIEWMSYFQFSALQIFSSFHLATFKLFVEVLPAPVRVAGTARHYPVETQKWLQTCKKLA